jgi:MSHA biogenesis protein MshO
MSISISCLTQKRGFTLIELIIVILIIGIISGVLFTILRGPMTQFIQVEQRANLVDVAETALLRMTREIRLAVPNSVRVSGTAIEFLRTVDGGRYRRKHDGTNNDVCVSDTDKIRLNKNSDCFEVLGSLDNLSGSPATGANQADCFDQNALCLVIFNTGQSGANAYAGDNIAAVSTISSSSVTFDNSGDVPGFKFPHKSPRQRFQIVDTPVSFLCDTAANTIRRYAEYDISSTQPTNGAAAPLSSAAQDNLLVNMITACSFTYAAGTATRAGLVTLSITVRDNDLGQEVTLLQQAHVDNQP